MKAQTLDWESFMENLLLDAETDSSWSDLYDDLCALHENPININGTTTEELLQLPFLAMPQIEELEAYVYSYGPLKSLGELNLVKGLDYETRQKLRLFLYCGPPKEKNKGFPSWKNLVQHGKNELLFRTDVPFYDLSADYLGSSLYHSMRYKYKYGDKIEAGLTAEKDMGERGLDSYSFYTLLANKGMLKKLIVGNYRLGFAQGLVLNTGFSLGKTSMLSSSGVVSQGIKPHSSTSESNYFRGIASTVQLGKFQLSAFFSYRNLDATLSGTAISTLKDDGYHRTALELSKKGNVQGMLTGGNLAYDNNRFHVGFTSAYMFFNRPFKASTVAYRKYYPVGNRFWNSSVDYSYKGSFFSLMGEWALSAQGGWATLNSLQLRLSSSVQLSLLHRYYDQSYNALYGRSFAESSQVKNENGLYIGTKVSISRRLSMNAYLDLFQFPYLKYGVSKPGTKGLDMQWEMQYNSSDRFGLSVRYRNKIKQADYKENGNTGLAYTANQKGKFQLNYAFSPALQGKTILNGTLVKEGPKPASAGYSLSQTLQYKIGSVPLQLSLSGIYFHTQDYDSRVSSYEQGILYSYSINTYYGEGYRISALVKYDLTSHLSIQGKYGFTHSLDKDHERSTLQLQLRCKF